MIEYLATSAFLFFLGLYCLGTKRNLIKGIIGMVILSTGANLNFIYFSFKGATVNLLGHTIVITIIVLEGCMIAITLAYVYVAYQKTGSLDVKKLKGD